MRKVLILILFLIVLLVSCGSKEYTIKFVDYYDKIHLEDVVVKGNEIIQEPKVEASLFKFKFSGWYEDSDFNTKFSFDTPINKDYILYAKWEEKTIDEVMINYIDNLINNTYSYVPSWNKEGFKGRWNYIDGVFLNSIVNLYRQTGNAKYRDFFLRYVNYYLDGNGSFINPEKNTSDYKTGELDSICESRILFDAYEFTGEQKYLNAVAFTYNQLINMPKATGTNNFCHKTSYPDQIWLDGMYMYVPFYARYAFANSNNMEIYNTIKEQYAYIRSAMFDEEKGLYYHGHDTTKSIFWADSETGNSSSFWLRSLGWLLVSMIDTISIIPDGELKTYLCDLFKEGIDGVLKYQDAKSQMFYQLVDQGAKTFTVPAKYLEGLKNTKYQVGGKYIDTEISNYLESSGSSMIAYCLLKGSNLGILNGDYESKGLKVFEGIYNLSFVDGSLENICITAGLGPENNPIRDGSIAYYLAEPVGSDDAKGVGPFIMAYLEYRKAKK